MKFYIMFTPVLRSIGKVLMKVRGYSHPRYFARGVFCSLVALLLLLCALNIQPAFAQAVPVLRGVSPPQASIGEQLDLVLDGDGFTQLDNLTSINIGGVPVSYSKYEIVDDQTITVSLQIPEQSPTGDQRITFIFDYEYNLVAPFLVLQPAGPAQAAPVLKGVFPGEARIGEQLVLGLDGDGFSQFSKLTNVNIGGVPVPFSDYEIIDYRTITVSLQIPEQNPIGDQVIAFIFDNEYRLEAPFGVLGPSGSPQEGPFLNSISPFGGHPGEQLTINLGGGGFSRLGAPQAVEISGLDASLLDYSLASDQAIQVLVRIPEDAPPGQGDITFYFENGDLNAPFIVLQPGAPPPEQQAKPSQETPLLFGVSPQQGRPGEQLPINLDGGGFSRLGALQAVEISGLDASLLDYSLASDQAIQVLVRIPQDVPSGEGDITFHFENGDLNAYFVVVQPGAPPPEVAASPVIQGVSPQEAHAGSDLSLRLSGENLSQLGDLQSVDINGIEIPDVNYQVLSDQTVEVQLTIPADIPTGSGQISFFFDNSTFEAPFNLLSAPQPPFPIDLIILVLLIAGVIGFIGMVGFIGGRLIRGPGPQPKSTTQEITPTSPQIYFKTHLEPGSQSIETSGPSINAHIDIRLVTTIDQGFQDIELEQDSLTAE